MSLAAFGALPAREAAEWERFALEGPGDFQIALTLAKLLLLGDAALGKGRLTAEEAAPWLDGVFGAADEIREARRAEERQAQISRLGAFAKAAIQRRGSVEGG